MKSIIKNSYLLLAAVSIFLFNSAVSAQPHLDGPYAVSTTQYNLGDQAFRPSQFNSSVEVVGEVYHPTDLSDGPYPLVLFMHGNHSPCYDSRNRSASTWPCPSGYNTVESYRGYAYMGRFLASHGFIVVSIGANGVNMIGARESDDLGMVARAELIDHHLELWQNYSKSSSAQFGTKFVGAIDMNRVGTMGHSRGGEGVAEHFLFAEDNSTNYDVKAVLMLAPTNFKRNLVDDVNAQTILPYCDGDVSDLQGVHYYDDARYELAPSSPDHYYTILRGANHNFFNTYWTPAQFEWVSSDDAARLWSNNDVECGLNRSVRMPYSEQQDAAKTLVATFFRSYLNEELGLRPYLKGDLFAAPGTSASIRHAYHAPLERRLTINSTEQEGSETQNDLGGSVSRSNTNIYDVCGDDSSEHFCLSTAQNRQPHNVRSAFANTKLGLAQLKIRWNGVGSWVNNIPAQYDDFSQYDTLSVRAAIDQSADTFSPSMYIELEDANGVKQSLQLSPFGDGLDIFHDSNFKTLLSDYRVPLSKFNQLQLTQIRKVTLKQNDSASSLARRGMFISDLALIRERPFDLNNPVALPFSQSFESGLANWRNSGEYNMLRRSGSTPSSNTGPSTAQNGTYYMFLETSSGSAFDAGDTALLESPVFDASSASVSFAYSMYGSDTGKLAVDVLAAGQWQELWSREGQQHSSGSWSSATVPINVAGNVKIRFRASGAGGYRGDIAIDNVRVENAEPQGPLIGSMAIFHDGDHQGDMLLALAQNAGQAQLRMNLDDGHRATLSWSEPQNVQVRIEYQHPGTSSAWRAFKVVPSGVLSTSICLEGSSSGECAALPDRVRGNLFYRFRVESGGNTSPWQYSRPLNLYFSS
ncbi:hypothetical protein [Agaribacterium haliotis]|uniref:poly(ethylene terephthalate) hydrolase family protein n=1 Tax=Agaribacterium haliotis TaxID=2013869 RepID=UPI000BB55D84|nr:hypothetical protein [Agaribacterium haliotis]